MRKIDESMYVDFTLKAECYNLIGTFPTVMQAFNNAKHGTVYGRKLNGDVAIIDQK